MIKAGHIISAGMFLCALLAAAVISPLYTPGVAIFAVFGAGYLTGVFEKPRLSTEVVRRGTGGGAIWFSVAGRKPRG